MSRLFETVPSCVICGEVGERVRHGVWRHALPFGGDGVGPNSHGFTVGGEWIEADRRHKDELFERRESRIREGEASYWRQIGAEDVARRSKLEKSWREWENDRG